MKQQVAVVIPIYKTNLSYDDRFSLNQCFDILAKHPIIAIKPKSLDINLVDSRFTHVISFDDHFFLNVHGYNQLMLSSQFYSKFNEYEFMLIYQLDALVFFDELKYWCEKGYDYIGAPWLYSFEQMNFWQKYILLARAYLFRRYNKQTNGHPDYRQLINVVGNGGLSLRKVEKFHDLTIKYKTEAKIYKERTEVCFNEDVFWSIEVNRKRRNLKIPDYKVALRFSFENDLMLSCDINNMDCPFGCHAFNKHITFWMPTLEEFGYEQSLLNAVKKFI
ncbi:hypothetical protein SAMN05421820_101495 [Pedobacter steynii]|uniref:DUF5672 domain-containing protein n=1 Tax=Pedobacter steynii TaxID=430522 RepID=A0A1G9K7N1_9SPHI|nr:DUF5672 family protein [Pedobacter steynii]NQX38473.1 hypothetical protein [Pedobacter steynii]SDL45761.1 hypothetical protein SAMN05421820_101495 [Pedobacter steynii]